MSERISSQPDFNTLVLENSARAADFLDYIQVKLNESRMRAIATQDKDDMDRAGEWFRRSLNHQEQVNYAFRGTQERALLGEPDQVAEEMKRAAAGWTIITQDLIDWHLDVKVPEGFSRTMVSAE